MGISTSRPRTAAAIPFHPRLFRIGDMPRDIAVARSTGFPELDRELPGRGWPCAGLIEIGCDASGIGELTLLLNTPAGDEAHALWVLPPAHTKNLPWIPYAPGLAARHVALERLALVRADTQDDALWTAEQALRSGACETVMLWLGGHHLAPLSLRRLQQAAMTGNAALFAMRPLSSLTSPSPAVLRLGLHAEARGRLRIDLIKRRGLPDGKSLTLTPRQFTCLTRDQITTRDRMPEAVRWLNQLATRSLVMAER